MVTIWDAICDAGAVMHIWCLHMGGFLKWWVSATTIAFPIKKWSFLGWRLGVPPFKETPIWSLIISSCSLTVVAWAFRFFELIHWPGFRDVFHIWRVGDCIVCVLFFYPKVDKNNVLGAVVFGTFFKYHLAIPRWSCLVAVIFGWHFNHLIMEHVAVHGATPKPALPTVFMFKVGGLWQRLCLPPACHAFEGRSG